MCLQEGQGGGIWPIGPRVPGTHANSRNGSAQQQAPPPPPPPLRQQSGEHAGIPEMHLFRGYSQVRKCGWGRSNGEILVKGHRLPVIS